MKLVITSLFLSLAIYNLNSQTNPKDSSLSFSGYTEFYYSYDFSKPRNHEKPNFIYNHKRHNEFNLNLGIAKINISKDQYRGNLAFMIGNYAQYNLSSEPTWAQFVNEANLGIKLSKKHNLWFDIGIMPSHIGFESAISADCWTLTRSILAENSPYYESGAKISYTSKNEKLNTAFLVLNGWQRIQRPTDFQSPSFGLQINYKPQSNLIFNYSNFTGTNLPDSMNSLRTYHNFYLQYESKDKWGIIAGLDLGTESSLLSENAIWYSPVIIFRYQCSKKITLAARGEYYQDKNQLIIPTSTQNGFQVSGISSNLDYKINDKILARIECKKFTSKDVIFQKNLYENYSLTSNLSIKF